MDHEGLGGDYQRAGIERRETREEEREKEKEERRGEDIALGSTHTIQLDNIDLTIRTITDVEKSCRDHNNKEDFSSRSQA